MPHVDRTPVSVLIPAYNSAKWLRRSVLSILGDGVDEIVVVDDGSNDNTAEIARDLAAELSCVTFHSLRENEGAASARLRGAEIARNEWLAPLDSDDFLGQHAVSTALWKAREDAADICIWTMYRVQNGEERAWPEMKALTFPMSGREAARLTLGSWRIHPSGVVRRDLFIEAAKSVQVEAFNADELVTRELFLGAETVTACSAGYFYLDNPSSTGKSKSLDRAALARSQLWLLRFARHNGFLEEDSELARVMVREGLSIAEQLAGTGPEADLENLLGLLSECSPLQWRIGRRELREILRGKDSRSRIRSLRRRLRAGLVPQSAG